ncbi:MAG: hypothetical protein OES32_13870 [Acidobacteriota bacterium]|nr:hypothetical protein [Acidobacteriota bacterium]MDH3524667.1 hypothetical protein [Acidobacteriota bacterium]
MMSRSCFAAAVLTVCLSPSLTAQPVFDVEQLACLPLEDNGAVEARVEGVAGGDEVRLYYRRLNPVGAFYYGAMDPSAPNQFWSTFPRPEDREQHELTEEWWEVLRTRDWVEAQGFDFDRLRDYLESQNQEAAEYYVAVYDAAGKFRGRSPTLLTEVRENDCRQDLTPQERGWADNLTVGETSVAQANKEVFHWLCDGIVTRIDTADVLHPDEFCRSCVVGFGFVPPLAAVAAGVVSGAIIEHPPSEASPRQP